MQGRHFRGDLPSQRTSWGAPKTAAITIRFIFISDHLLPFVSHQRAR